MSRKARIRGFLVQIAVQDEIHSVVDAPGPEENEMGHQKPEKLRHLELEESKSKSLSLNIQQRASSRVGALLGSSSPSPHFY